MRDLVKRIEEAGGRVVKTKRNSHLKVYLGPRLVGVLPATPSDFRTIKNVISDLRKKGLNL